MTGKVRIGGALLLAAVLALGGCARSTGDFGRAAPSFTHDTALPAIGAARAQLAGEPVSRFNLTDAETEMHDRVWRFLVAAHANDWFYDVAVELQRTRISTAPDTRFGIERYYDWIRAQSYRSSEVRFATLERHVLADLDTVPGTFASICRVVETDRQRAVALGGLTGLASDAAGEVAARRAENEARISWFARALDYRYRSYGYALDNLVVETPHGRARDVDRRLGEMRPWVERARRGEFCGGASGGAGAAAVAVPGRVLMTAGDEAGYRK